MKIAVDFDGTIVEDKYPEIGKPQMFVFETLKELQKKHQLILWTCREGRLLDEAVAFCEKNGVRFYAVNRNFPEEEYSEKGFMRKLDADMFIDDRNFGGFPGWSEIYQTVNGTMPEETKSKKKKWFWQK
ncbi:MAG: hypothetical protein II956_12540 [Bacteroidales bacterium]|nr:hypothetical protein [Bacteroidales bacterium]